MISEFRGYPEISILNPQTRYFHQNVKWTIFENGHFWGCDVENWLFEENGVMDMANMLDSGQNSPNTTFPNIFSLISAISANLSKSQKNHILKKKSIFLIENRL